MMIQQQEKQRGLLAHSDEQFPVKLYAMLELAGVRGFGCSGCSWLPHGRAFRVDDETEFMEVAVPMFFKLTKIRSFYRQLNLWGFKRVSKGIDAGAWYHKHFLRGSPDDVKRITRTKVKGVKSGDRPGSTRPTDGPGKDPDFYSMPPLPGLFKPTDRAALTAAGFPLPVGGVPSQGRAAARPRRVTMESAVPALRAAGSGDSVLFKYVPRRASIGASGKNNPQSSMPPSYGRLVRHSTAATGGCPSRRISMDLACPPALQGETKAEQPRRVSAPTMGTTGSDIASLMQMRNEMTDGAFIVASGKNNPQSSMPPSYGQLVRNTTAATGECPSRRISMDLALQGETRAEQPRRVSAPTMGTTGLDVASLMQMRNEMTDGVGPPSPRAAASAEQHRRVSAPTMGTTGSDIASLMQMRNEMTDGVGPPSHRAAAIAKQHRRISCPTIGKTGGLSTSAMASLVQRCEGAAMTNSAWIQRDPWAREAATAVPVSASAPASSFSREVFGAEDVRAAMGGGLRPPPFSRAANRDIADRARRQPSGIDMHNIETTQGAPPSNRWSPLRQTSMNPATAADPSYDSMANFVFQKHNSGAGKTPRARPARALTPLHASAPAGTIDVKGLITAGLEPLPFVARIDTPPANGGRKGTGTQPVQCEAGTSEDEFANYIANVIQPL